MWGFWNFATVFKWVLTFAWYCIDKQNETKTHKVHQKQLLYMKQWWTPLSNIRGRWYVDNLVGISMSSFFLIPFSSKRSVYLPITPSNKSVSCMMTSHTQQIWFIVRYYVCQIYLASYFLLPTLLFALTTLAQLIYISPTTTTTTTLICTVWRFMFMIMYHKSVW